MPKKTRKKKRRTSTSTAPAAEAAAPAKHPVLLDKASLAVHEATASDPGRYIVDHIHVEQDGTTVGMGEKLILAVQPPETDPGDLPAGLLQPADVPEDGMNLPATMCKAVMGNLKGHAFRPALECAVVTRCDKELVELSSTTDLKRVKREGEVPAEGTFPRWKGMVERPLANWDEDQADAAETFGPVVQMGFRLDVLEQLVKTLKKVASGDDSGPFVRFSFNANEGMVLIDGKVSRDRRFIGMTGRITPKFTDTSLEDLNDWQNAILDFITDQSTNLRKKREDNDAEEDE